MSEASWRPDPTGRHQYRYWDGSGWTDAVADNGLQSTDTLDAPIPSVQPTEPQGTTAYPWRPPPNLSTTTPWYEQTWFIIVSLVFCFPVGLIFMWRKPWQQGVKIAITATIGILFIGMTVAGALSPKKTNTAANPTASSSPSTVAPAPTTRHAPPTTVPPPTTTLPPPTTTLPPPTTVPPPTTTVPLPTTVDPEQQYYNDNRYRCHQLSSSVASRIAAQADAPLKDGHWIESNNTDALGNPVYIIAGRMGGDTVAFVVDDPSHPLFIFSMGDAAWKHSQWGHAGTGPISTDHYEGYPSLCELVSDMKADEKLCPYCAETTKLAAIKCRYCGEMLETEAASEVPAAVDSDSALGTVWQFNGTQWRCTRHDRLDCGECYSVSPRPTKRDASTSNTWFWRYQGGQWRCTRHDVIECAECFQFVRHPKSPSPPGDPAWRYPDTRRYDKSRAVPIKNGVPTCSVCGGTQFTARRKTSTKVLWGFYSLAGTPHWVECEVCGQRYARPKA
jgi:hypothetical protein